MKMQNLSDLRFGKARDDVKSQFSRGCITAEIIVTRTYSEEYQEETLYRGSVDTSYKINAMVFSEKCH